MLRSKTLICSEADCDTKSRARGLCRRHYTTWWNHNRRKYTPNGNKVDGTKRTYYQMLKRCNDPKNHAYKDYGGRGIKVCERWLGEKGYDNFLSDMGQRPDKLTLDRIDNNESYSSDNCRWVSMGIQAINKRVYKTNKSGVSGVVWHKQSNKWRAKIMLSGTTHSLGLHTDINDAIKARRKAEKLLYEPLLSI